jgi:hypothetical protein
MMRRISYRSAVTAFVFAGLWFVLGLLLLWSPIPGALGIRGQMLVAWLFLFLLVLAGSGAMLTLASYNGIFPPDELPAPKPALPAARAPELPADPVMTTDGKPMPWTQSPLPERPARHKTSNTAVRQRTSGQPPAQRGR